jgi:preprotein translocase subunit SecA
MLGYLARKVIGTKNDRTLRSLKPLLQAVNDLGKKYENYSDEALRGETFRFRERLDKGESLNSLEAESYAVVREGAKRVHNMRHFDVQIIGGAVLHRGMIAEMRTGEGKTLVATLPAYLNALSRKGVHVVTVNDYLARRDAEWMGYIYRFLGLEVGCVHSGLDDIEKQRAYSADITYGQNNEFGFDYLRDNMKYDSTEIYQQEHNFAIVDEVDSILIDEARTPLIISGPVDESTDKYYEVNRIIPHLKSGVDYEIDLRTKNPTLTEAGITHAEKLLEIENLYGSGNSEIVHHVNQALKAHTTLERDVDYVVNDGQIVIVDEFTGRLMPGRRWSNGLHQAIEAKEGVRVQRENRTLASITFQNFFRMYTKLSGMTGTADTESVEFKEIYKLDVVVIPPNRPTVRKDLSDLVYRTRDEKYRAVVSDIEETIKSGQPILVGTVSIDQSERLSKLLKDKGISHKVLNAKQHEREAEIVAQAGRLNSVTISTNMAGRGTDIILGGNPEFLALNESKTRDRSDPTFLSALDRCRVNCEEEKLKVLAAGGLAIIGTERHESRRIDNQLRGRAGRQGDPGVSRFYISLEDELMRRFAGDRIQAIMSRLGWEEGVAMDGRLMSHSIETAQKRVEAMHFESRKHVTEYDDVLNKQRNIIYALRRDVLGKAAIKEVALLSIEDLIEDTVLQVCDRRVKASRWDHGKLGERFQFLFNAQITTDLKTLSKENLVFEALRDEAVDLYERISNEKEGRLSGLREYSLSANSVVRFEQQIPTYEELQRRTFLEAIDIFWNNHLQEMDDLREGIGLRGYGQKNPLYEYKSAGLNMFLSMILGIKEAAIHKIFHEEILDVRTLLQEIAEEEKRRQRLEDAQGLNRVETPLLGETEKKANRPKR